MVVVMVVEVIKNYIKGSLAQAKILDIDVDDTGIQSEGQQFELRINKAMENSRDLAEYVSKLEEADVNIEDNFSEDNLVEQIEDFLNNEGKDT